MMADTLDWKKAYRELYFPKSEVTVVKVPRMNYLMVDGQGGPNNSPEFEAAVSALYSLSYTIRFNIKKSGGTIYSVFPLEGLWWAPDMDVFTADYDDKSNWLWTIMIAQPDFVDAKKVAECLEVVKKKKPDINYSSVRFEPYEEGESAQMMYVGPYAEEGPSIQMLHDHIKALGGALDKKHHEIYLSDLRKVAPEKLKTVIRQPFKRK